MAERETIYNYSISTEEQVGRVSFRQKPTSDYMEMWGLTPTDDYDQWTVTLPSGDAASYVATQLGSWSSSKLVQTTATTLAGGITQVEVRNQPLVQKKEEEVEPPEPDPEEEPTEEEEEDAGEGPNNAKVVSCEVTGEEAPLPCHPEVVEWYQNPTGTSASSESIRNAIGMVHKGASIHRPFPINSQGEMKTPYEILGGEKCAILQSVMSFTVTVLNISFSYKTRRNMLTRCQSDKIGAETQLGQVPGNKLGSRIAPIGNPISGGGSGKGHKPKCFFMGRNITYNPEEKYWEVEERYKIEISPKLSDVLKRGEVVESN